MKSPWQQDPGFSNRILDADGEPVVEFPTSDKLIDRLREVEIKEIILVAPEAVEAVRLYREFINSLEPGALFSISCDIGALNDAELLAAKVLAKVGGAA